MNTPYNPTHPKTGETLPISVEDVMGYFSLLEKVGCNGSEGKIEGLKEFTQKVHPYALGMVQRLEDQTKLVASSVHVWRAALSRLPMQRTKQLLPLSQNASTVIAMPFRAARLSNRLAYQMYSYPKKQMVGY